MKKLFFVVSCMLVLNICMAEEWWKTNFIIGAHWGPPLHHKGDSLVRDFTLLKDGGFNFTLGKMNTHNNQASKYLRDSLYALIEECEDSGFLFLNEIGDPLIPYGINIKDEPSIQDTLLYLETIRSLKQTNPDKLAFINLTPSYGFSSFDIFKAYAKAYLGDTTLQVACFDNYNPHSQFSSYSPTRRANYYSNIAYMKYLAGSRPLWSYLRCSEKFLEEKDSTWQDAYIRLGAFAPLAFGSKGIIYFSYDCIDRNRILRSPGRGSWGNHTIYFDNDEKSRQIFFGNLKQSTTSTYPDLAIHTNDSLGTWRIKETNNSGIEENQNLLTIGTWYGEHSTTMPNIYNWDFSSDGYDKFTTITRDGYLYLSMFRSGWIKSARLDNFPTHYWSTMSRHTCPFGDFNSNQMLDLCLGWVENGQGKLRIYMDCHDNSLQDPPLRLNMTFANSSQIITFCDPIKQAIAREDSIYVITSRKTSTSSIPLDSLHILKYNNQQFNIVNKAKITLPSREIEHYWIEETLLGQDNYGGVWGESANQVLSLTNKIQAFSSNLIYVWGQYNSRSHQYDRYGIAPDERDGFQAYALLNRKGKPNRIYQTAKIVNQFINDSISSIILNGMWQGAYFSSIPNNQVTDSLKIIKNGAQNPLICNDITLSDDILFGLFEEGNGNYNLLVINMKESSRLIEFNYYSDSYHCDKITRMTPAAYNILSSTIQLNNMLGGECAILHFTRVSSQGDYASLIRAVK